MAWLEAEKPACSQPPARRLQVERTWAMQKPQAAARWAVGRLIKRRVRPCEIQHGTNEEEYGYETMARLYSVGLYTVGPPQAQREGAIQAAYRVALEAQGLHSPRVEVSSE